MRDCRASLLKRRLQTSLSAYGLWGETLGPDRISGSLFLARGTERQSGRALSQLSDKCCGSLLSAHCRDSGFRHRRLAGAFRAGTIHGVPQWPRTGSGVIRGIPRFRDGSLQSGHVTRVAVAQAAAAPTFSDSHENRFVPVGSDDAKVPGPLSLACSSWTRAIPSFRNFRGGPGDSTAHR